MFNSLTALPQIPYKILTYLAVHDEIIWKLLKYNSYDALSKPNLKFREKIELIWREGPQAEKSIFLTNLIEDVIPESKQIIKIYSYHVHPNELYLSTVVYAFDCLYGGQMSLVDYNGTPVSRGDLFINRILTILNGAYVGGVGKLTFYDDMSRYDIAKSVIGNAKNYTGIQLFMSVNVGDGGGDEGCGD